MKKFQIAILAILFIAVIVFLSYRAVSQTTKKNTSVILTPTTINPSPSGQLVGNDRDEHGCIPSAGYSWCAEKNKCLRPWEESCGVEDDDNLIKQALYKKNNWDEGSVTVVVSANDGKYAKGTANAQGGGGLFFAEKVNGIWEIVYDGNGIILCSALEKYPDFPTTLIPQCYDQSTDKLIER